MIQVFEFVALAACGLLTGANVYIATVEHPVGEQIGSELKVRFFRSTFRRAHVMQASLTILGLLFSIAAWLTGAPRAWIIGAAILASVLLLTLIIIKPVNKRLLEPSLDCGSARAQELISRWSRLHLFRSGLSIAAFCAMTCASVTSDC
jgi:hypothetical protein